MPLNKLPSYLAAIAFLNSYLSVKRELHNLFFANVSYRDSILSYTAYSNVAIPFIFIEDSVDILEHTYKNNFAKICETLAKKYFILKDNHTIYIKKNHLEDLKQIESQLDSFLIEGFFIMETSFTYSSHNRHRFLEENVKHDKFTQNSIVYRLEHLTDLHTHLGANLHMAYRLNSMFIHPSQVNLEHLPIDSQIGLNTDINIKDLVLSISVLERCIIDYILNYSTTRNTLCTLLDLLQKECFHSLNHFNKTAFQIRKDTSYTIQKKDNFLLYMAHCDFCSGNIIYADKYLMLFFIELLFTSKNRHVQTATKTYLTLRNLLTSQIKQQYSRAGLGYFSTYSRSTLRRSKLLKEKTDIIRSSYHLSRQLNKEINIEVRITPNEDIHHLKRDLKDYINAIEILENKYPNNQTYIKFIYHFIKKKDIVCDKNTKCTRFYKLKVQYKKEAKTLVKFLSNKNNHSLTHYFHGIDGASKEYHTPPYVFAPIYRYFQHNKQLASFHYKYNRHISKDEIYTLEKPRYTYHVGEDFKDINTGIRNIFESVIFLSLEEEDRLGHAVALGLDATLFYERVGHIQLENEEYFDNLVFIYYILELYPNEKYTQYKSQSKEIIRKLGTYLYSQIDNIESYSIDDYIDAWYLRRNCHIELRWLQDKLESPITKLSTLTYPYTDYSKAALPDFLQDANEYTDNFQKRYTSIKHNQNAVKVYECFMSNSRTKRRGRKIYKLSLLLQHTLITYIQKILIKKLIIKRGIAIEVMPTSNLLISHIRSHSEHPMYMFKPIKSTYKNHVKIYIASDNPMIHNTNIAKEYDYIYNYIRDKYNSKIAFQYLKEIAMDARYEFKK